MTHETPVARLTDLSASTLGVFRGRAAVARGVTRKQLGALCASGVIERLLPDTYRMSVVAGSHEQLLRAALAWAGPSAAAAGTSAAVLHGLEGVAAGTPEIVVPRRQRLRSASVVVHRSDDRRALMVRRSRGLAVTGVEATLLSLVPTLDAEALEVAFEDARRRRLTSTQAVRRYLDRYARRGLGGAATLRELLGALDPEWPARSVLEVKTRRLLVANGLGGFVREFPLADGDRVHRYDFAYPRERVIVEVNGRRWHDDPSDYEHDHRKWSVPARHGFRIVLATWDRVVRRPRALVAEVGSTVRLGRARPDGALPGRRSGG
jgi:predicted transcriptional regulator of viral defense system/very-short-patch-repair endonuclease